MKTYFKMIYEYLLEHKMKLILDNNKLKCGIYYKYKLEELDITYNFDWAPEIEKYGIFVEYEKLFQFKN